MKQSDFNVISRKMEKISKPVNKVNDVSFPNWSDFQKALFKLVYTENCSWGITINGYIFDLDYDPDLVTVFEKLSEMLEHIAKHGKGAYNLYFFEQGTDLNMKVSSLGDVVEVSFETYDQSGFKGYPKGKYQIDRKKFMQAWLRFVKKVLGEMVLVEPEVSNDLDFMDFQAQIKNIEMNVLKVRN